MAILATVALANKAASEVFFISLSLTLQCVAQFSYTLV